jgi:hypothetical protein
MDGVRGEEFCTPRLSNGMQLTSATNISQVRQAFGAPKTEDEFTRSKVLVFVRGKYFMTFEFEQPKEQLLLWSVALDD